MIELDFDVADAPELWNLSGAGATEEQSLYDLYAGRLRFQLNGIDLSPVGLVPFLGVVTPMNAFLAASPPPKSTSWEFSDQSSHGYSVRCVPSGRVHVRASWSDQGTTCLESSLRPAWGCFVGRILRVVAARDPSAGQNVVVQRMNQAMLENQGGRFDAAASLIALRGLEGRGDRACLQSAADAVVRVAWEYGGFTEIGISPIIIEVENRPEVVSGPWSGQTDAAGRPVISCVVPDGVDSAISAHVIRDCVLTALRAWGVPEQTPVLRGLRQGIPL